MDKSYAKFLSLRFIFVAKTSEFFCLKFNLWVEPRFKSTGGRNQLKSIWTNSETSGLQIIDGCCLPIDIVGCDSKLPKTSNFDQNITHVGIYLGSRKIIHAFNRVRIDKLNEKGIINSDTLEITHKLQGIRRII